MSVLFPSDQDKVLLFHHSCSILSKSLIFSARTKSTTSLDSFTCSYASGTDTLLTLMHALLGKVHQSIWSWGHNNTLVSRQQNYLLGAVKGQRTSPFSSARSGLQHLFIEDLHSTHQMSIRQFTKQFSSIVWCFTKHLLCHGMEFRATSIMGEKSILDYASQYKPWQEHLFQGFRC